MTLALAFLPIGAGLVAGSGCARAQASRVDGTASARIESTDNFGLSPAGSGASTLAMGGELQARRETEVTRARATLALEERRISGGRASAQDIRLSIGQAYTLPTRSVEGTLDWQRNGVGSAPRTPDEALAGSQGREARTAAVLWSERWSPLWSARARLGWEASAFQGAAASGDFRNASASLSLDRSLNEISSVGANLARSDYRLSSGLSGTVTTSVGLNASHDLDERSTLTVSVGGYRSMRRQDVGFAVCPLPIAFCLNGFVPLERVVQSNRRSDDGLQYDAAWRWRPDERTDWSTSAARQQQPGVLGVQRSQTFRLRAARRLGPHLSASAELSDARNRSSNTVASPVLQSAELAMTWQAAPEWSMGANASTRRLRDGASGLSATSNTVSVTLTYQPQRLWSDR